MIYSDFNGNQLSLLGFGMMRLPTLEDESIDEEQTAEMLDYAIKNGVNYFDTAFPYHNGKSEIVTGKLLKKYPRDSYYLATKYPGHQIAESYNPQETFELQLQKCGVDYFDFYLLHNIHEKSVEVYMDPQWGIVDYFVEEKKKGRIRNLGFSFHGNPETLEKFLDYCGDKIDFCQIQLNYLDWTLQEAEKKYNILTQRGIPVWVMEPVRGGKLAKLDDFDEKMLWDMRPKESTAAWAFRWLQGLSNVKMILSGMSNIEQVKDNIKTFSERKTLSLKESERLMRIAEGLKNSIACTSCRYCCKGCPKQLDIPELIKIYNDMRYQNGIVPVMRMGAFPPEKLPSACIGCKKCEASCPQDIKISSVMKKFADLLDKQKTWEDICRERAEKCK